MSVKKKSIVIAFAGVAAAIAITATMDATGYTIFSALPLFGLWIVLWLIQGFSAAEVGMKLSGLRYYGLALLYPASVMPLIAVIALAANQIDTSGAIWTNTLLNISLGGTVGIIMVLITEEMFFRGWLWAALERAGFEQKQVLIWTSVAFMLWHVSWATVAEGFELPQHQAALYLLNVLLIGAIWGAMRMLSGSVIVASVSHAVWNAFAYALFGMGTKAGDLGIEHTLIFGPEVGVLGVLLNLCFLIGLWYFGRDRNPSSPAD